MIRLICRLLLTVFVVACLTDSVNAQRFRRVRRYVAATVARANAEAAFFGPGFYPPMMAPPFAAPLANVVPPFSQRFGLFPSARPVFGDPVELDREPRDVPQSEATGDAPSPSSAAQQSLGHELRAPEQRADEGGLSPPETVPLPAGELRSPLQERPALRPRRGREF